LASASSNSKNFDKLENKTLAALEVGKLIAKNASKKGISLVKFDRGGYLYHGRVKSLADGAREGGLKF
jgi:large subunit ribosomal protein L18